MTDDKMKKPEPNELDALELSLKKKARMTRIMVVAILVLVVGVGGWFGLGLWSYTPPEPTPLEELLTGPFVEVQLSWFDMLSTSARVSEVLAADKLQKLRAANTDFITQAKEVDPKLEEPFKALLAKMESHDQFSLLAEEPDKALAKEVSDVNAVLATMTPKFVLDVEPFEGLLGDKYLVGGIVCVYELLETYRFKTDDPEALPIELKVVRRRDAMPGASHRHGFVNREDAAVALVLQDNATTFAADYIFPSFERVDAAFDKRFEKQVDDYLKEPYGVLVELVQLELRTLAGGDEKVFKEAAANVAKRAKIYARIEEKADKLGIRLKSPGGLLWPRTFANKVLMENTKAGKEGERLIHESNVETLIHIARALDDAEADRMLGAVTAAITRSVAFHEARHVVDIRDERWSSLCIDNRVQITDGDPEFLRDVELEARAYLTQIVESPETIRQTLLSLVSHLYYRSGTSRFYAAREILHPLVFEKGEKNIPRGYEYLKEMTLRLGALQPDLLEQRALGFWQECFEEEYPQIDLISAAPTEPPDGCSVSGF